MKKLIPVYMALAMTLVGCGALKGGLLQESGSADIEQVGSANSQQTQTEINHQTETEAPQRHINEAVWPTFRKTATIEETVLLDEYDLRIIATEIRYDNYSAKLGLTFENNSEKDIRFVSGSVGYSCNSVNGYMIEGGYLNCDVAAGKKAKGTISFNYDVLMSYGINEIADVEVGFDISDDDYNHIYSGPCQVKTSVADEYDYEALDYSKIITSEAVQYALGYTVSLFSDEILYEENGIDVVSDCLLINKDGETLLMLEVNNMTAAPIVVTSSNININGLGIYSDTWSADMINSGKTGIIALDLSKMLDGNFQTVYGLQEIGNISLSLNFMNTDRAVLSAPAVISVSIPNTPSVFDKNGREVYNSNDIRIVMKDIVEDDSDYRDDMYILLFVENNTTDAIFLREVYDSFSVNGYMMDCFIPSVKVESGACSALEIRLWESDLEENSITTPDQIDEIEFSLIINNSRQKEIDKAIICIDRS